MTTSELFGGAQRRGAQHQFALLRIGFVSMAGQMPRLAGQALRLGWTGDRLGLVAVVLAELGQGVMTALGLLAIRQVLTVVLGAAPTPERLRAALPALAGLAVIAATTSVLRAVSVAALGRLGPRVKRMVSMRLLGHAIRVELATIEDAEFHNLLKSAQLGAEGARQMVQLATGMTNGLIGLAAIGAVFCVLHPVLIPLLVLIVVPKGMGVVRSVRRRYISRQAWLEHTRQQDMLANLLIAQKAAEEVRAHGAGSYLLTQYECLASAADEEQARLTRAEARTTLVCGAVSGLATLLAYLLLGLLLAAGTLGLAVAITTVLAIRSATGRLGKLVTDTNLLYQQALFVNDLNDACRRAEQLAIPTEGRPAPTHPHTIRLRGVSYQYPNTEVFALREIDVDIHRGQVTAFVGANGSGKSTLAKLIAGLYQPTAGQITWDSVCLSELNRASVFDKLALIGQSFMTWPFTARVNVTIGRPNHVADPLRLPTAAAHSGAETVIDSLPQNWDTLLTPAFVGGVNLSGGQWQRMALARGWFRDAHVLIFDEPTASLDPQAEVEVFTHIRALADQGCAVILITHRLAAGHHTDHIYLLDKGRIIEHGTHTELMHAGIEYPKLYRLQAEQYTNPETATMR